MNKLESAPADWTKLERIRYLLDLRSFIFDPNTTSPFGTPGDGSGVALLPLMSRHHSVVELERVLKLLFTASPGDYRHLAAYRWCAEWRTVTELQRRRRPNGKHEIVPVRVRARLQPRWLDVKFDKNGVPIGGRVARAESFLEQKFRGDVDIPMELWRALNEPAVAA